MEEILKALNGKNVHKYVMSFLEDCSKKRNCTFHSVYVVNPDFVLVVMERSEWADEGGIAYYSQLRAYWWTVAEPKTAEWQWRDQFDAKKDHPERRFLNVVSVEIEEIEEMTIANVVLDNGVSTSFVFYPPR